MAHGLVYVSKLEALIPASWTPFVGPVKEFLVKAYFYLVYLIFAIYNFFQEKKVVKKSTDPITFISATKLAEMIRKREIKSIDIIESYIKRIEEVNDVVNAVAYRNFDEAREMAREVDERLERMSEEEIQEYCSSGPLLGLPFTTKDSISCAGKVITAGIWSRREAVVEENAEVVQRMLDAGAILLCITTIPVACVWIETSNGIFGRTNNPYDSRRTVGGSSGGEGALHGAGASLMGVGSDIGGSIRIPSFFNGIFGFLTSGVVSTEGHIPNLSGDPYRAKMLKLGPITRFAEDIELLTNVLSNNSIPSLPSEVKLENSRIYYINGVTHCETIEPMSYQTNQSMKMAVAHFEKKFNKVALETTLPASKHAIDIYMTSFKSTPTPTMAQLINCPFASQPAAEPLYELYKYFAHGSDKSHYSLISLVQALTEAEAPYTDDEIKMFNDIREAAKRGLEEMLADGGLLFFPSFPTSAPFHNELLVKQTSILHTAFFNTMLLPAIQCPMGLNDQGIPTGILIMGGQNSDRLLIKAAEEISRAFGGWVSPGNKRTRGNGDAE